MIHREGTIILLGTIISLVVLNGVVNWLAPSVWPYFLVLSVGFFLVVLQFFRNPKRSIEVFDNHLVYAPADGKVVVIEEVEEPEYFKDKRLQVSIFMSPFNVHVNRNPVGGIVKYYRYHEGKYLVAWHPKASTENERTTVVIASNAGEILFRQIAGALAKRIKAYVKEGQNVEQGAEMGFIKFGSRVDVFLPLDAKVEVSIGDKVSGNKTVIATLS